MRPPLSVTGTRWTRWTPLSNFSLANTPLPSTEAIDFLEAARSEAEAEISSTRQPCDLGIALVHAEQVAREQRRLVAAGAGADFEHRRALVGRVARQQRQRQAALGESGSVLADRLDLLARHRAHLVIGIMRHDARAQPRRAAAAPRPRHARPARARHIPWRRRRSVGRQVAGRHQRLQLVAPRLDLRDPVGGDGGHRARKGGAERHFALRPAVAQAISAMPDVGIVAFRFTCAR
jgi:hypothetical protein